MSLHRRQFLQTALAGSLALANLPVFGKTTDEKTLRLGITLEPPGLDPTVSASSSISEICLYNIYETLTKITPDGTVEPLLATSWEVAPDACSYKFNLQKDVYFHNGKPFNAHTVAFTFERAAGEDSTNKDKQFYTNIKSSHIIDSHTILIELHVGDPDLLFKLGMGTAIMVEPESVSQNRVNPVGTGPYRLQRWRKGAVLILEKWPSYRVAPSIAIERAIFQFINDSYAQMASLLTGEIDIFSRVAIARSLSAFSSQPERFQIIVSNSRAKTLMSFNQRRTPLNQLNVRRALACAIDRQMVIEGAADGYGIPIGSHYTPDMPGFIDTTGINPYNFDLSKRLLKDAGVTYPLEFDLILPPTPYARQGGEIIAAMLSKVNIKAKIQNVEWAQWLSRVYTQHDFDLSIVSHVEPFDLDNYTRPDYYWGYESADFNALYKQIQTTLPGEQRNILLAQAQQLLAHDVANAWLYQPRWITVANKNIKGLWSEMPIFANDLSAMSWA